jgi:hypothetical protein
MLLWMGWHYIDSNRSCTGLAGCVHNFMITSTYGGAREFEVQVQDLLAY